MTDERATCTYKVGDFGMTGQRPCGKPAITGARFDKGDDDITDVLYCKQHWNAVGEYVEGLKDVEIYDPIPEFC